MAIEIIKGWPKSIVVARSTNLRGVLSYGRNHRAVVEKVSVTKRMDGSAHVYILWTNSSECRTSFADYTVALKWFRARRSWELSEIFCSDILTTFVPSSKL